MKVSWYKLQNLSLKRVKMLTDLILCSTSVIGKSGLMSNALCALKENLRTFMQH